VYAPFTLVGHIDLPLSGCQYQKLLSTVTPIVNVIKQCNKIVSVVDTFCSFIVCISNFKK